MISALKFQLIDQDKLTAQQYKDIFMKNIHWKKINGFQNLCSLGEIKEQSQVKSIVTNPTLGNITPRKNNVLKRGFTMSLEMQNIWHLKVHEELVNDKKKIGHQIVKVKKQTQQKSHKGQQFKQKLTKLKNDVIHFEHGQKQLQKKINSLQNLLQATHEQFSQNDNKLLAIQNNIREIFAKYNGENNFMQIKQDTKSLLSKQSSGSPVLNSGVMASMSDFESFIIQKNQKSKNYKKSNNQKAQERKCMVSPKRICQTLSCLDQMFQKYQAEIQFNVNPCLQTQSQLLSLIEIIKAGRFQRKSLKLVFRLSTKFEKQGNFEDIYQKNNLLFIIRTSENKVIGAFISVPLPDQQSALIDPQAFLFSIANREKFNFRKNQDNFSIIYDQNFMICFNYDLMISRKWNQEKNYCGWPKAYEESEQIYRRNSKQFVGKDLLFTLVDFQCYQIQQEGFQMMII